MINYMIFNSKNFINYSSVFFLILFLYFWDIQIYNTDIKLKFFAIFFAPFFLNKFLRADIKKILFFFTLIILHKVYFDYLNEFNFNLFSYFKLLIAFLLILFFAGTYEYFFKYLENIILFVLIGILIYFLLFVIFADIENKINISCYNGFISQNNFLYKENSHFGFSLIGIFFYSIYQIFYRKITITKKIIYFLGCILIFINYSTSFIVSSILVSTLLLIYFLKIKKNVFPVLIILLLSFFVLQFDKQCNYRISTTLYSIKDITLSKYFGNKFSSDNKLKKYKTTTENSYSVSSVVYVNSFLVLNKILKKYPVGVGFDNLKYFFKENISSTEKIFHKKYWRHLHSLNHSDGSNNFIKLFGEFGIPSLLIFYFLIKFILNKNISIDKKLLLLCPFIDQFLFRGAGYFNGGFLFYLFILIILNSSNKKII